MGAGCTKHNRKLGKHSTVAPKNIPSQKSQRSATNEISHQQNVDHIDPPAKSSNPFDEPIRIIKPLKSTNPFDEDDEPTTTIPLDSPTSHLFTSKFVPTIYRPSSSSIDQHSILYRSTDILSAGKRNVVRDHIISESVPHRNRRPDTQRYLNELNAGTFVRRKEPHYSNLYRRLGGSFQTLVSSNKSFSASETNLCQIRKSVQTKSPTKRFSFGGKGVGDRHSSQADYCPSVLFNRITAQRQKENADRDAARKRMSFSRLNILWKVNFIPKKRKDCNSRKT